MTRAKKQNVRAIQFQSGRPFCQRGVANRCFLLPISQTLVDNHLITPVCIGIQNYNPEEVESPRAVAPSIGHGDNLTTRVRLKLLQGKPLPWADEALVSDRGSAWTAPRKGRRPESLFCRAP
jgi:hypothetical protein